MKDKNLISDALDNLDEKPKILGCPFCGSIDDISYSEKSDTVCCLNCGAGMANMKAMKRSSWNTRMGIKWV